MGVYEDFSREFPLMEESCNYNSKYNFNSSYGIFETPCEIIAEGVDASYNYGVEKFVMNSYYDEYDCSILDCFSKTKNPRFLISEKTKDYASNKVHFLILVSLILIGVMFLLIEIKSSLPIIVGIFLTVISLLFMKLDSLLSFVEDKMVLSFVSIFFTQTYNVFLRFLFLGIFVLAIGIIWKLFLFGFKVNKFISWFKEWKKKRKSEKAEKIKNLKKSKKGEVELE
jgi:hypothetical protein